MYTMHKNECVFSLHVHIFLKIISSVHFNFMCKLLLSGLQRRLEALVGVGGLN